MSEQAASAPAKVHSKHARANEAIESLREVAATLQAVGDDADEVHDLRDRVDEAEAMLEQVREDKVGELADWRDAIDAFRLELIDRDELLGRTIRQGMTFDDERRTLALARDWKEARIAAVHPSVGRLLNQALTANGEDPVPFGRATNSAAPSLVDLIRAEYERAPEAKKSDKSAAARRFAHQMSESVHGRSRVSRG